jgi:hypothetical protein
VERFVVRVWLPDRPGALGQVASRIGAVRGDVVGIEILEQGGGRAVDELVVALPEGELVELLVDEIGEVDGVDVEWVQALGTGEHDPHLAVLEAAARLVEHTGDSRAALDRLCADLLAAFEAEWAVVVGAQPPALVASAGTAPDPGWLAAFLAGSRHLDGQHGRHPEDVAWGDLGRSGARDPSETGDAHDPCESPESRGARESRDARVAGEPRGARVAGEPRGARESRDAIDAGESRGASVARESRGAREARDARESRDDIDAGHARRGGVFSLAVGRHGRPFRARERRHIELLARVAAATVPLAAAAPAAVVSTSASVSPGTTQTGS